MKNYESLFAKIEECTEEFKQNLRYNEFEKSLTDLMHQHLAEHIQEVLETLMHDKWFISVLCSIAGKSCLSFEGYRLVSVSVLNDQRILVSTPYFYNRVKEKKKKGRKKKGRDKGNNIDCYLGLKQIGMVGSYSGRLASEICTMALLAPSEDMAVKLLSEREVVINVKTLRKIVRDVGQIGLSNRGVISLGHKQAKPSGTLVIGIDGGRIRERQVKPGRKPQDQTRQGYTTDWKEPVLFTMYVTDEKGNVDKRFQPVYDATMQGKDYAFELIETYLDVMDTSSISRMVFCGDGAPWIWSRAEEFLARHFPDKQTWQILDYTHAKQALEEILDLLPVRCKEADKIRKIFREALWKGEIDTMEKLIRVNFTGKRREKALNKWSNYFHANVKRMQYSFFKDEGLPQGSGCVESAIRRVINLRLKSCGSFWKKENAEIYLFLRSQLLAGRWITFFENLTNRAELFDNQIEIKSNHYLKWAA
jgi:hypothetical protein